MLVLCSHKYSIKYYIFKMPIEMHDNQKICLHKKQQKQKVNLYVSSYMEEDLCHKFQLNVLVTLCYPDG